jgi:predicted DCC family thiol-disulfide oxidoreductase YuxK
MRRTLLHPFTFRRARRDSRETAGHTIVFYDGTCGLCHRWVRFILRQDPQGKRFKLSPLQGSYIKQRIPDEQRQNLPDSIVVIDPAGSVLTRSAAVLHILSRLGRPWRILSHIAAALPRPLRDALYDAVAAIRYKLFPRQTDMCPTIPDHLRDRFQW